MTVIAYLIVGVIGLAILVPVTICGAVIIGTIVHVVLAVLVSLLSGVSRLFSKGE